MKTLKRILSYVKPYGFYLTAALLFALISVALTLYAPILIGNAVDIIVGVGNVDFDGIVPIIFKILIIVAGTALAQWLMALFTNKIGFKVARDIREQAFAHIQQAPLSYLDKNSQGDIIGRVITDVDMVSDGLLMGFTQLFTGVVTILGTLIFMLTINPLITIIVVVITPLSFFVAGFIAKKSSKSFKNESAARGEMTALAEEFIGNQKLIKAFAHENAAQGEFETVNEKLRASGVRALVYSSFTNPSTRFVNGLVYAGVGVFGAISALSGGISVGQLSCFLTYANQYTKPFNEISGVITEFQSALASARRVFELIDAPQESSDVECKTLENVDGNVKINNVSFSYNPDVTLIEGLNLDVKSGQRIAIVGPTGCGKTTIINLLMRFYDVDGGEIAVSGYPIKTLKRNSLRSAYGMVLQETWLKTGTIFENIAYGKPDASMEQVVAAAKSARAHSFIMRLPNGYDTVISDDSTNISQGEKQLLCIARVMLCLPPMLILDEATSSIDTITEMDIQHAFAEMMKGRTSFIVAHRLSTIKEADCILVMKAGHIIEQGTHSELLEKNGFYADLYNSQFKQ